MLFDIPYEISVTGCRNGNRRTTTYKAYETMEVDIPVVDPDMAPIAVEWDHGLPDDIGVEQALWRGIPVDGIRHVRLYGDDYYETVDVDLPIPPFVRASGALEGDDLSLRGRDVPVTTLFRLGSLKGKDWRKEIERNGGDAHSDFDTIQRSTRDRTRREIRDRAASLVLVDGRVYRRCSAPVIAVVNLQHRTARGHHQSVSLMVTSDSALIERYMAFGGVLRKYPITEFSKALAYARRKNGGEPEASLGNELSARRRPIVHMLAQESREAVLRRELNTAIEPFLKGLQKCMIGDRSTREIASFCRIKDALLIEGERGFDELEVAVQAHVSEFRIDENEAYYASMLNPVLDLLVARDIAVTDLPDSLDP